MTLRIVIEVNGEPVRSVSVWNVGHPKVGGDMAHDDLRRYNYCEDGHRSTISGFVHHRRGLGAAELARKVLTQIGEKEGTA